MAAPPEELASGQQKCAGRGITVWFALTEAVKIFGTAATTQDFPEKLLKWQADVWGESTKCATFKTQAVEAANLRVLFWMVKEDVELKLFHYMLKYNDLFFAKNLSGNVIAFMGGRPF